MGAGLVDGAVVGDVLEGGLVGANAVLGGAVGEVLALVGEWLELDVPLGEVVLGEVLDSVQQVLAGVESVGGLGQEAVGVVVFQVARVQVDRDVAHGGWASGVGVLLESVGDAVGMSESSWFWSPVWAGFW